MAAAETRQRKTITSPSAPTVRRRHRSPLFRFPRPSLHGQEAGLTLLELVGVATLVALLFTTAVLSVRNITGAELRTTSSKLAAAMRGTFNLSVTRNRFLRLVVDLDNNVFWTEEAEDRFFIGQVKEEDDTREFAAKERWKGTAGMLQLGGYHIEDAPGLHDDANQDAPVMHRAPARELANHLIRRTELPRGITFEGVMTSHQRTVRTEGKAYIYFFPNGQVERAMIYLSDGGDRSYTIVTQPLTGRVVVQFGKMDVPSRFDEERSYDGR